MPSAVEYWIRILAYVNLAGAVHALAQAAVFWRVRSGRRRANRLWATLLALTAALMCHGVFTDADVYDRWPWVGLLMSTLPLLMGPLFFFSVRALTDPTIPWRKGDALHAVPFLAGLATYVAWRPDARFVQAIPLVAWHVVLLVATVQTVLYLARIRSMLRRHEEAVRSACSTVDEVTLGWLRRRLAVYGVLATIGIVVTAIVATVIPGALGLVTQILFFLVAVNTFLIGYRAMLQPAFFVVPEEPSRRAPRYEHSSLTLKDAERYEAQLLALMECERPFLNPSLTLPALAQALDVQPAHLSRVINERLARNFFEFVNEYRVRAACERLASPGASGQKLITVALESGFNSLATFNRVFKDLTGRTPSDYRRHPDAGLRARSPVRS